MKGKSQKLKLLQIYMSAFEGVVGFKGTIEHFRYADANDAVML